MGRVVSWALSGVGGSFGSGFGGLRQPCRGYGTAHALVRLQEGAGSCVGAALFTGTAGSREPAPKTALLFSQVWPPPLRQFRMGFPWRFRRVRSHPRARQVLVQDGRNQPAGGCEAQVIRQNTGLPALKAMRRGTRKASAHAGIPVASRRADRTLRYPVMAYATSTWRSESKANAWPLLTTCRLIFAGSESIPRILLLLSSTSHTATSDSSGIHSLIHAWP